MAGHTIVARVKAFFHSLFRKPVRAHKVPLHILDGVCCDLGPADRRVQDYLYRLRLKDEYKKPRPFEGYLCDEEGIDLLEFNTRKAQRIKEREREMRLVYGVRSSGGWGYSPDGEAFHTKHPEVASG